MNRRSLLAILLLATFAFGQQPGGASTSGTVVKPCTNATVRGCTVSNTSPCDGSKKAKIQEVGATAVRVTGDNGISMDVTGLETGDTVELPNGSVTTVSGTGSVSVGSGCTTTLTCPAGSTGVLTFTLPGGQGGTLTAGNSVTLNT